jgi:hypothetical protein
VQDIVGDHRTLPVITLQLKLLEHICNARTLPMITLQLTLVGLTLYGMVCDQCAREVC